MPPLAFPVNGYFFCRLPVKNDDMKSNHFFVLLTAFLLALFALPGSSAAQKNKDSVITAGIAALVANQDYTFKPQTVTPLSGRLRQLTSEYSLQVSKDAIVSQLPYFGRAYSAPIGSSDAGIQFTSKDFEYKITNKKKGGWDVNIKFKDTQDAKQMQLSIFDNGTASLQVISNNRQSISFSGYIISSGKPK